MDGYNLFGKSKYFAPRVRWSILEKRVEKVKEAAKEYEDAFNNVMAIKNVDTNFNKVSIMVIKLVPLTSVIVPAWEKNKTKQEFRLSKARQSITILNIFRFTVYMIFKLTMCNECPKTYPI